MRRRTRLSAALGLRARETKYGSIRLVANSSVPDESVVRAGDSCCDWNIVRDAVCSGTFIPCAQFMEIEWLMVAILCVSGVGMLNIAFSFVPRLDAVLPAGTRAALRVFLLYVAPVLIVVGALWIAFSPSWYALFNDPELLCD